MLGAQAQQRYSELEKMLNKHDRHMGGDLEDLEHGETCKTTETQR